MVCQSVSCKSLASRRWRSWSLLAMDRIWVITTAMSRMTTSEKTICKPLLRSKAIVGFFQLTTSSKRNCSSVCTINVCTRSIETLFLANVLIWRHPENLAFGGSKTSIDFHFLTSRALTARQRNVLRTQLSTRNKRKKSYGWQVKAIPPSLTIPATKQGQLEKSQALHSKGETAQLDKTTRRKYLDREGTSQVLSDR